MTHLPNRYLLMSYPRIVYQIKYRKDLEALFLTWIPATDLEHTGLLLITADGKGEFFDSYGEPPEFYSRNFETFLEDHSSALTWNEKTLQSQWS